MSGIFRASTTGTVIVVLFVPMEESFANTNIFGREFSCPVASRDSEGNHGIGAGLIVKVYEASWVKSSDGLNLVGGSQEFQGVGVLNDVVQRFGMSVSEFCALMPGAPTFICDMVHGSSLEDRVMVVPVSFC